MLTLLDSIKMAKISETPLKKRAKKGSDLIFFRMDPNLTVPPRTLYCNFIHPCILPTEVLVSGVIQTVMGAGLGEIDVDLGRD